MTEVSCTLEEEKRRGEVRGEEDCERCVKCLESNTKPFWDVIGIQTGLYTIVACPTHVLLAF